jgi:hypothetical protein
MTDEKKPINNGGPAFPFSFEVEGQHRWAHGLTQRDYIAIEMLKVHTRYSDDKEAAAKEALEAADAYLKVRDAQAL